MLHTVNKMGWLRCISPRRRIDGQQGTELRNLSEVEKQDESDRKPTLRLRQASQEKALFLDGLAFTGTSAISEDLASLTMSRPLRSP